MTERSKIKFWIYIFMAGLLLNGLTAFPLQTELEVLNRYIGVGSTIEGQFPNLAAWISKVHVGLVETNRAHPFLAYGTDWLAFAHVILAILFIGPLRDPVKNIWVIEFGIIACILVVPTAMICGHIREIPFFWRLIDSSFGVIGLIPLLIVRAKIKVLEKNQST
jgi:hypothetical protein